MESAEWYLRFCTSNEAISIFDTDPTFNIGLCFVTITMYRHVAISK